MASRSIIQIIVEAVTRDAAKDLDQVNRKLADTKKAAETGAVGTGKLASAFGGVKSIVGGILASQIITQAASAMISFGKDSVTAASDLSETMSKTKVVFEDSADAIIAFTENSSTAFGQSQRQALDAASNFAIFGKSAGLTGDELVGFSSKLTVLSSDLASFSNTSPEEAIQALGAALRGESEPIRRYGVLLNEATLKNKALEMGIVSNTKEALTPQARVLAAYNVILEQTTDAQGDFDRTSEGLANQQRILTAQTEDLKAALGKGLQPAAISVTKALNEMLEVINGNIENTTLLREAQAKGLITTADYVEVAGDFGDTMELADISTEELKRRLEEYALQVNATSDVELIRAGVLRSDVIPAVEDEITATEDAAKAQGELEQKLRDLKDFMAGPLREEQEDFTQSQADNREEARLLLEQIQKLKDQGYSETGTEIGELRGKLGELDTAFEENATAHEEATRKIIYNMLMQRASIDGLSDAEYDLMLSVAENWGLIDQNTATAARAIDETLTGLATGNGMVWAEAMIENIKNNAYDLYALDGRTFKMGFQINYSSTGSVPNISGVTGIGTEIEVRAAGGPIVPGGTYLVGEAGPELLTMGQSGGMVTPISNTNNVFNLNMTSNAPVSTLTRDFSLMQSMVSAQ